MQVGFQLTQNNPLGKIMLVTLNTDASFHKDYNVGAFAFWILSNDFKIKKAGSFQNPCKDPTEAEIKCILNALTVLLSTKKVSRLIINTDSMNSISVFTNNREKINRYGLFVYKKYRRQYKSILKKYDHREMNVEFRHVKAHSGKKDKRSYVNEWCDTQAKYFLWQKINQMKRNNEL